MTRKTIFQYLAVYLSTNMLGLFFASKLWWNDSVTLSFLKSEAMGLAGAFGLCWIGVLFLGIMITRLVQAKNDFNGFFGPLGFLTEEKINKIGMAKAKEIRTLHTIVSFGIMAATVVAFMLSMSLYKNYQLENNSVARTVVVGESIKNAKGRPYMHFSYEYLGEKYDSNLPKGNLQKGDTVKILFSKSNPMIVDYAVSR